MLIFFLRIFGFGDSLTLSSIHHGCSFLSWLSFLKMLSTLICLFTVWFYPNLHFLPYLLSLLFSFPSILLGGFFFCTFADHFLCLCVFSSSGPSWIPLLVCIIFYGIHCFWNLWKMHLTFYLSQYVWIQWLRKSPVAWFFIYISILWLFMSVGLDILFSFI